MSEPIEMCCNCDSPTGRAGDADDSTYCDCGYGPLCDYCYWEHDCDGDFTGEATDA